MRLLHINGDGSLSVKQDFVQDNETVPRYAALSHRWISEDEEHDAETPRYQAISYPWNSDRAWSGSLGQDRSGQRSEGEGEDATQQVLIRHTETTPCYEALSYAWDSQSMDKVRFASPGQIHKYTIPSHTWLAEDLDVKSRDPERALVARKTGSAKAIFSAERAMLDSLQYFWVDTSCIDRKRSSELIESIARMFRWYAQADKCYVFLKDATIQGDSLNGDGGRWLLAFRDSEWYTQGWTLQELLATKAERAFGRRLGDVLEPHMSAIRYQRSLWIDTIRINQAKKVKSSSDAAEYIKWFLSRATAAVGRWKVLTLDDMPTLPSTQLSPVGEECIWPTRRFNEHWHISCVILTASDADFGQLHWFFLGGSAQQQNLKHRWQISTVILGESPNPLNTSKKGYTISARNTLSLHEWRDMVDGSRQWGKKITTRDYRSEPYFTDEADTWHDRREKGASPDQTNSGQRWTSAVARLKASWSERSLINQSRGYRVSTIDRDVGNPMRIMVVGEPGAGRTAFIERLARYHVETTESITGQEPVETYLAHIPCPRCNENYWVKFIDRPGFDRENLQPDKVELTRVVNWLNTPNNCGKKLHGITYVASTNQPRPTCSGQNIAMFKQLIGEDCHRKVLLVTTFWDDLSAVDGGLTTARAFRDRHMQELQEEMDRHKLGQSSDPPAADDISRSAQAARDWRMQAYEQAHAPAWHEKVRTEILMRIAASEAKDNPQQGKGSVANPGLGLRGESLTALPAETRLSWTTNRSNLRQEDQAYSLLGPSIGFHQPICPAFDAQLPPLDIDCGLYTPLSSPRDCPSLSESFSSSIFDMDERRPPFASSLLTESPGWLRGRPVGAATPTTPIAVVPAMLDDRKMQKTPDTPFGFSRTDLADIFWEPESHPTPAVPDSRKVQQVTDPQSWRTRCYLPYGSFSPSTAAKGASGFCSRASSWIGGCMTSVRGISSGYSVQSKLASRLTHSCGRFLERALIHHDPGSKQSKPIWRSNRILGVQAAGIVQLHPDDDDNDGHFGF